MFYTSCEYNVITLFSYMYFVYTLVLTSYFSYSHILGRFNAFTIKVRIRVQCTPTLAGAGLTETQSHQIDSVHLFQRT